MDAADPTDSLSTLAVLERRYGPIDDLALDRVRLNEARNRLRREAIERQIDELVEERRRLDGEWSRMRLAHDVFTEDLADRIRRRHGEGWSPTAVVGYRMWVLDPLGRLTGATGFPWTVPVLEASCARAIPGDDLPHTVGTCSDVGHGCGIYATRSPHELDIGSSTDWMVGAVALSGKVVEHERGYRAFRATVTALTGHAHDRWIETDDGSVIEDLFGDPAETIRRIGAPHATVPSSAAFATAAERLERNTTWT